jgi:hypothetical protein
MVRQLHVIKHGLCVLIDWQKVVAGISPRIFFGLKKGHHREPCIELFLLVRPAKSGPR